jgi:hypothetical protein
MPPRRERPELKPTPQLRPARLLATLLTVVLVIGGGWLAWKYVGTNIVAKHRQGEMAVALADDWRGHRDGDARTDEIRMGEALAVLRIPRFGKDFEVPVVAGVDDSALTSGVGWFPDTQRPGERGNFAVAGHRITNGQPFKDFPDLQAGDKVFVETRTRAPRLRHRHDRRLQRHLGRPAGAGEGAQERLPALARDTDEGDHHAHDVLGDLPHRQPLGRVRRPGVRRARLGRVSRRCVGQRAWHPRSSGKGVGRRRSVLRRAARARPVEMRGHGRRRSFGRHALGLRA